MLLIANKSGKWWFLLTQSENKVCFAGSRTQTPKIDKLKTEDDYVEILSLQRNLQIAV